MFRYLLFIALASVSVANAQLTDSRLPISLDADFLDTDIDSNMMTFRGLRLNQGLMSIEADTGRASKLDFNDSVWQLAGNVSIVVEDGRIDCEAANLEFGNNQLRIASISGEPATFELTRGEVTTFAEAEILRYDLEAEAIEFSGNAKIVEGGNQIASGFLVYNIRERRIQAQGSEGDDGKVKITFTPSGETPDEDDAEPDESDNESPRDEDSPP
ncbi:MAG: LptA/OstA family protein [Pseudomonadota bacterium]